MKNLKMILVLATLSVLAILVTIILLNWRRRRGRRQCRDHDIEKADNYGDVLEDLVTFEGGQEMSISDILDAPGEVIGKSNYGTIYKALLQKSNCVRLLRFMRPVCTSRVKEFDDVIRFLGGVRHPNLVPLLGFYAGPRGEKLLVFPFLRSGNLAQFIRDWNPAFYKWSNIYRISLGIARGLDHLHTGMQKPVIHGNLKSKNILLDRSHQPYISDYGLYLLLNPSASQEMLEASAAEGYKPPELIKMKEAREETDIFSFGIILLELLSGKEPINENPTSDEDFYLPTFMRNAVLEGRITDLYHPGIVSGNGINSQNPAAEECILKFFQLAMACCSPSPTLRPNIKQVLMKLEEIGTC